MSLLFTSFLQAPVAAFVEPSGAVLIEDTTELLAESDTVGTDFILLEG